MDIHNCDRLYLYRLSNFDFAVFTVDAVVCIRIVCCLDSGKYRNNSLHKEQRGKMVRNVNTHIYFHTPYDLMLFRYENEPIIVFFEQCYFCLFSNVILIFDKSGVFSTAIDPSALKVKIKRDTTAVTVSNGNAALNQYIADDSKCISQGSTRSTWLHTCREGSSDLRYSYNPRLEYRTDTYEYVSVEFIISDKRVAFTASSSAVGDAFEKVTLSYTRKCNNRHDPIPEFLMLLKKLNDDENAQIESIIQVCNARSGANNYFCKLIAS